MTKEAQCLPYRISLRTSRSAAAALHDLASQEVAGVGATERGTHYLLLQDLRKRRYGPDLAVGLGIGILLIVLIGYAFHPLVIALLPLALTPALPLLVHSNRTLVAVSAVSEPDGMTRLTAHGQVSPALAAALDAYFGSLPTGESVGMPAGPPGAPAALAG
ncbi:MAG: hypothetical protein ABR564_06365 [Candidatus Dormibacteria bacterium]